ncbi:MAG: pilus assembly protein [Chloroflexi bacterium]|nr:MAG: pilus assembly protein [Chloroflexota bacterium]TMG60726.1 MAG: pilus assembly protein [Chloroflexota bacterium]
MGRIFGRFQRALRDEFGQSMVELALLLPILVFGLIGAADLARAFAIQLAIENGARAGAEAYAINFAPTPALASARAYDEISRTPGIDINNPLLVVDTPLKAVHTDGSLCTTTPTVLDPCWYTVTVTYEFHTLVPWPFIPNTANFNRSTTIRTFY